MITIEMSTALMIYLGLFLGLCFTVWLLSHKKSRKRVVLPERYHLVACEYCHFSYLSEEEVSKCPECSQFNRHA